jgi:2-dehydropantoate 2-reductase
VTVPVSLSHWHILGAGAIGGLWAFRLHAGGHAVSLIERSPSSVSLVQLVLSANGRETRHTFPLQSPDNPDSPSPLLVTTKAGDTAAALSPLLATLKPGDIVLLLQNGMGVDEWLRQLRPDLLILTGITTDGVYRTDRHHLVLAGEGRTLLGGEAPEEYAIAQQVAQQWLNCGTAVEAVPDIRLHRWQKLAVNCAINPLTALYRCRNGELEHHADAISTMRTLCAEVAAVMQAEGIPTSAEALFASASQIARQTAANTSSMLADVMAGRKTEIDFMNGHVENVAMRYGIPVPTNHTLIQAIRALHPAVGPTA